MSTHDYVEKMKNLQNSLLTFIENDEDLNNFRSSLENYQVLNEKNQFHLLLLLISKISRNHHRISNFVDKIMQVLQYLKDKIREYYTDIEIFNIFQGNKRILLAMIEENILIINDEIAKTMFNKKFVSSSYPQYFFPEIKPFLDEETIKSIIGDGSELKYVGNVWVQKLSKEELENFEEKRKIGEDDRYLYTLIRNDSIDEFIQYLSNQQNMIDTVLEYSSIFETNQLLNKYKVSLIEYAAFFGSIKIFKYLQKNGAEIEPSLWIFAVHGHNYEMIHLIEELFADEKDLKYQMYFEESVRCHHNDIANYFLNNYIEYNDLNSFVCIKQYNFEFFPDNLETNYIFCLLCKNSYTDLVKMLVDSKKIDINAKIAIIQYFHLCNL